MTLGSMIMGALTGFSRTAALSAEVAVELVNAQLTQRGAEFTTSMAQPAGPFGAVVFGSIEDHGVRPEFFIEPAANMCAVHLSDMTAKKVLADRVTAPTFPAAIEAYPWEVALASLPASPRPATNH